MAKQTQTAALAKSEVVEGTLAETGEVFSLDFAALEKVEKAKETDFQEEVNDFWKPIAKGDELRGIYVGFIEKMGNYNVYGVAKKHPKVSNRVLVMRFICSRQLKGELNKGEKGQAVRIVFNGQVDHVGTDDEGQPIKAKRNDFKVTWLPKA